MARLAPAVAYLLALAIGCAFVAWLFPTGRLFPAHPLDLAFSGDEAQHVIGQRYFIRDVWHWPLLVVRRLNAPEGVNIAYTDSIPLAALALKLARGWLPDGFTLTEGWIAVAYALQPLAAVFALRSAGEERLVPTLAMAAISLSMPPLLARFGGHEALCSHFLILAAIGVYFRQTAPEPRLMLRRGPSWAPVPLLLVAALLIHPYLACMAALVLAAAPLTLLLRRDPRWLGAATVLLLSYGVLGGTALALNYTGGEAAQGFGLYSMNLLGPVMPGRSFLFPTAPLDATGGQALEGYQYLGAGVLLLAAAALACSFRRAAGRRLAGSHHGLAVLCLAMAAFALSNRVTLGHRLLFRLDGVPAAVAQFQATGRFFWPVGYVIAIASIVSLGRRLPQRSLTVVLLIAAGLQVVDATTLRSADYDRERFPNGWSIPHDALWPAFAAARQLTLWPTQSCSALADGPPAFMQALLLASAADLATNTMYLSRYRPGEACDAAAVLSAPWQPGELRVIVPPASTAARWLVPDAERTCREAMPLIVCADAPETLAGLRQPAPSLLPRDGMVPATDPAFAHALAAGWSAVGPDGAWTIGREARLIVELAPDAAPPTRLTLRGFAIARQPGGTQRVEVVVQGQVAATWEMPEFQHAAWSAELPPGLAGRLDVTLRITAPTRPADRGMNADARPLGLFIEGLQLD